jgi:lipoprotein-anchoring transpeptidase ErfK/SrfK
VRSKTFIAVAAFVVLLLVASIGVYAYDAGRKDRIAEGVTVGGVMVGGLDREAARAKLTAQVAEPVQTPVYVRAFGKRYRLTERESRVRADVDAMVDDALSESRKGNMLGRAWREATGGKVDVDIQPKITYSEAAVDRLVARVKRHVDRDPKDASIKFASDGLKRVEGKDGLKLRRFELRGRVKKALGRPAQDDRTIVANAVRTKPKVGVDDLEDKYETALVVDRGGYRLRLYKKLKLEKTYPIAVGQVGLETPAGLYKIQNKAVNPAWSVPNSAWAGSMAGQVVPGGTPQNPLKARWLGIYNGAGIHGTDQTGSIGTNASHGCVRMLIPDVIELYDRVPVGAPVYIA